MNTFSTFGLLLILCLSLGEGVVDYDSIYRIKADVICLPLMEVVEMKNSTSSLVPVA